MKSILEALQYPTPTSWSSLSCAFRPCSLGLEQLCVVKLSLFRTAKQKEEKKKPTCFFSVSEKKQKRAFAVPYFLLYLSHVTNNVDFYQLFITCERSKKKKSVLFDMEVVSVSGAATRLSDSYLKLPPPPLLWVQLAALNPFCWQNRYLWKPPSDRTAVKNRPVLPPPTQQNLL